MPTEASLLGSTAMKHHSLPGLAGGEEAHEEELESAIVLRPGLGVLPVSYRPVATPRPAPRGPSGASSIELAPAPPPSKVSPGAFEFDLDLGAPSPRPPAAPKPGPVEPLPLFAEPPNEPASGVIPTDVPRSSGRGIASVNSTTRGLAPAHPSSQAPRPAEPPKGASSAPESKGSEKAKITRRDMTPLKANAGTIKAETADEVDMWGGGSRVAVTTAPPRAAMPTLVDPDPLAFDIDDTFTSPPRDSIPEELGLDLADLRDPKLAPAARPGASGRPWSEEAEGAGAPNEPKTEPYPLDDRRFASAKSGTSMGHLRTEPSPMTSSPRTLSGLADLLEGSEHPPPISPGPATARGMAATSPGIAPSRPSESVVAGPEAALRDMRDRFALGDFSGALAAAELVLQNDPHQSEATRYAETSRMRLTSMYESKLGSMSRVPRVVLPPDQVRWLSLDHRAGFVLSCIDGYSSIEEILDVSGMPTTDALRILTDLLQQRVIAIG
jgi:hypothetical protein